MTMIVLAGLAAAIAAAPAPDLTHQVRHDHQGRSITATYRGTANIALTQRGMAGAPGRMGTQRCDWTASVHVARSVADAPAAPLGQQPVIDGSRPGDCLTVAAGIYRDVARRQSALKDHVVTVAEADRRTLVGIVAGTD